MICGLLCKTVIVTLLLKVNGGVYHIFENHYNYKFLRDGPTDPNTGLVVKIIRLNVGDIAPEDRNEELPLATASGCRETYKVLTRLTAPDKLAKYKKSNGTSYSVELEM